MINDACHGDRTTVLKKYNSEIYSRCEIISTCEIKKGDEITFDYNKKVTTNRERKGDKKSNVILSDEESESDSRNADDLCSDTLRDEGSKKNALKKITNSAIDENESISDWKRDLDTLPYSYPMIVAGLTGCALMMISQSHLIEETMKYAHTRNMFRILVSDGMIILFTDNTYHAGASTTSSNDKSVRFFGYVHKTDECRGCITPKPSGNEVESVFMKTCADEEITKEHGICNNSICKSCEGEEDGRILDFTSVNLGDYNVGDVIGGSIDKHGWAVVKGTKVGEEDKFKSIVVDCGERRKKVKNALGNSGWTNGLDVGTPLSVGGSRNRKKKFDYRQGPVWVQNHGTITC